MGLARQDPPGAVSRAGPALMVHDVLWLGDKAADGLGEVAELLLAEVKVQPVVEKAQAHWKESWKLEARRSCSCKILEKVRGSLTMIRATGRLGRHGGWRKKRRCTPLDAQ